VETSGVFMISLQCRGVLLVGEAGVIRDWCDRARRVIYLRHRDCCARTAERALEMLHHIGAISALELDRLRCDGAERSRTTHHR
jgi:hypothetical protein